MSGPGRTAGACTTSSDACTSATATARLVAVSAQRMTGGARMSSTAESAIARLWRDRVRRREQERNEAQTRACAAEERLAALTAETERLACENALVRAQNDRLAVTGARLTAQNERLAADLAGLREHRAAAPARAEPAQDLGAIRAELLSLLDDASGSRQSPCPGRLRPELQGQPGAIRGLP